MVEASLDISTPDRVRTDLLRHLARHPVLGLLPSLELESLLNFGRVVTYQGRTTIFSRGDSGTSVLAVIDGYVKLSASAPDGRDIIFEIAPPGSIFGELAVINGQPRSADATCLSTSRLLLIEGNQFLAALKRNPDVILRIVGLLSERLQRRNEQMEDTLSLEAPARLAKTLIRLAAEHSHPGPEGLQIDVQLSQGEIGGMTGLSREGINRQLRAWSEQNLVKITNKYLTLIDLTTLQNVANGLVARF
jgi:CRP/FNR family transcriptional regulator, cyclic AMP receptor protein